MTRSWQKKTPTSQALESAQLDGVFWPKGPEPLLVVLQAMAGRSLRRRHRSRRLARCRPMYRCRFEPQQCRSTAPCCRHRPRRSGFHLRCDKRASRSSWFARPLCRSKVESRRHRAHTSWPHHRHLHCRRSPFRRLRQRHSRLGPIRRRRCRFRDCRLCRLCTSCWFRCRSLYCRLQPSSRGCPGYRKQRTCPATHRLGRRLGRQQCKAVLRRRFASSIRRRLRHKFHRRCLHMHLTRTRRRSSCRKKGRR